MSGLGKVRRVVDVVNAERPDVVLLLGDFLTAGVLLGQYVEPQPIAEVLSGFDAPLGVIAVLGNHDWWKDGPGVTEALESVGIPILENSSLRLESDGEAIWVVGAADDTTRDPNFAEAYADLPRDAPSILITHDPGALLDYSYSARPLLMAAGHTHGGQIYLPWLFSPVVPGRAGPEWAQGLHDVDGIPLYVTSGIGTSILPVRINRPPEIVIIEVPY